MDTNQSVFDDFEVPDPIRIDKVVNLIKKDFPNVEGLNILECGLARGGVADRLRKEGAKCYGVDINPRQLDGVKIFRADLNSGLPQFDIQFDVIFAGEVIEHLFDDVKFIKECRKVLKQEGILILTTPNLVFGVNRLRMMVGKMPLFAFAPYHYRIYNAGILRSSLEQGGFRVLEIISSHILFSTRRHRVGKIFEILGDFFPTLGAHLIIKARINSNN